MPCLPRHMWTDFLFFNRGKKRESVWGSGGSFCSKSCVGYRTVFVKQGTVSTSCPVSSLQVQMGQFSFYNGWWADHIKSGIFLVSSTCQVKFSGNCWVLYSHWLQDKGNLMKHLTQTISICMQVLCCIDTYILTCVSCCSIGLRCFFFLLECTEHGFG